MNDAARTALVLAAAALVLTVTVAIPGAAVSPGPAVHEEPAVTTPVSDSPTIGHGLAEFVAVERSDARSTPPMDLTSEAVDRPTGDRTLSGVVGEVIELVGSVGSTGVILLGYSRFDDSDPLSNEKRVRLFEAAERSPGAYLSELAEATGIARSTVRYHVRILEEEGLVTTSKLQGKKRVFPGDAERHELSVALSEESTAAVITTLDELEAANVSELAAELDRSPATVSYHLERLEASGLIVREQQGNAVVNRLTERVAERLDDDRATVDERPAVDGLVRSH